MPSCVLIVDDDRDIRITLSATLADEGYTVATAADGAEALSYLRHAGAPCLILCDLMMPVMNGWELTTALQQDPKLTAIPLVMISANGNQDYRPGGTRFLAKPIDLDTLLATVEHACE